MGAKTKVLRLYFDSVYIINVAAEEQILQFWKVSFGHWNRSKAVPELNCSKNMVQLYVQHKNNKVILEGVVCWHYFLVNNSQAKWSY